MSSKRFIQLVGMVGGPGLLACSDLAEPRYQGTGAAFDPPIEVTEDTTLLSEAQRQRGLRSLVREMVPPALEDAICRALAKVPAGRFSSVTEFASAVVRAAGVSPWVRWLLPVARLLNWLLPGVRDRTAALVAAGALAVSVAGVVLALVLRSPSGTQLAVAGPAFESAPAVRVGVLPPEVGDASDQAPDRARLIQHLMASELTRRRGLAVVDPISLNSRLEAPRSEPGTDPIEVLRGWGVRYLVGSTVSPVSQGLEVSVLLTDTRDGHVVETAAFTNTDEAQLPAQVRQAAGRLLDALEVTTGGIAKALDMEPFLARAPANVSAVSAFLQGTDYSFRGLPGGQKHFEHALELDPDFVAPRVWLVSGLVTAGDTGAARMHVQTLQSLQAEATPFERALIGWSEAVVRGDWEAKVRHLRVALGYSPRDNALLYNLGYSLLAMGRPEDAVDPIREAVESGWRFAQLYTLWGVVAIEAGELDGLRETLEGARSITPSTPYLAGLLEALALFEGDTEAARRYGASFRAAVREGRVAGGFAEMVPVYRSLGQRARERTETETAAALIQRAVDAEPGQPIPRLELARVLAEAGERRAADTHYRAAARSEISTPDVLYLMGEVAALLGRREDARHYLTQYLTVAPNGPDAVRARERLRSLGGP